MNMKVIFEHNEDEVNEQFIYYTKKYVVDCTGDRRCSFCKPFSFSCLLFEGKIKFIFIFLILCH
jgi:hypothetical protein